MCVWKVKVPTEKKSLLIYEAKYKFVNYYFTNNTKYVWFLTVLIRIILTIITAS